MNDQKSAIELVRAELDRARRLHRPMRSAHGGYAVLLEEMDELWAAVKTWPAPGCEAAIVKEAVQVGAMALRFLEDVCGANH